MVSMNGAQKRVSESLRWAPESDFLLVRSNHKQKVIASKVPHANQIFRKWLIYSHRTSQAICNNKKIQLYSFLFFLFTPMPVLTGFVWTKKKKKLYALTFVDLSMDSNISNANDSRSVNIEFTKTLLVHWESREYSTVRLGHWRCCRHTWANEQQCQ